MVQVQVRLCDVCRERDKETPAEQYRVSSRGRTAEVDLCEEHSVALEELLFKFEMTTSRRRRQDLTSRITTLEDIEREKRERKQAPKDPKPS